MAFAAARMILKDKRRKPSREEYPPRSRSKARSKQAESSSHLTGKSSPKPSASGGNGDGNGNGKSANVHSSGKNNQQSSKSTTKPQAASNSRNNKKNKSGQRLNQHDLIVTIDLSEHGLTEDQVADFKEAFMLIDTDEDGHITVSELGVVMKSLGQRSTDKELKTLVREVSNDNLRTTVEFNEFLQLMSKKMKNDCGEGELLEAFRVFDKLGQGWIMATDLRDVMKHLGERLSDPEVDDMLKEADREGKGRVFYQEFVGLLTK